jgi:hypothetical protein
MHGRKLLQVAWQQAGEDQLHVCGKQVGTEHVLSAW